MIQIPAEVLLGIFSTVLFVIFYLWAYRAKTGHPWRFSKSASNPKSVPGYRYPFTPYPTGWYFFAEAGNIKQGKVYPIDILGRALIAFRTLKTHRVVVLDAHCPHLGAHIAYGGRVVGNCVECPFHGWKFNPDGICDNIPYSASIPKTARLRSWPVMEKNELLFVWNGPVNTARNDYEKQELEGPFDIPDVKEVGDENWALFHVQWTCRVHIQEVAENALDTGHFNIVHAYETKPDVEKFTVDKHKFTVVLSSLRHLLWVTDITHLHITYFGMGVVHARDHPVESKFIRLSVILTTTPVDEENCEIHIFVRMYQTQNFLRNWILRLYLPFHIGHDFYCDIPIWENKVYKENPAFCKGDGPISAIRRWAKQFYRNGGNDLMDF